MALHPKIRHEPDPGHPGWMTWDLESDDTRFNASLGKLLVRGEGEGKARCRMFPDVAQSNLGDIVHGGAILTFIDMAMFAGGYAAIEPWLKTKTPDPSGKERLQSPTSARRASTRPRRSPRPRKLLVERAV